MKYTVKDYDPATDVPNDEERYTDEFVVRISAQDHFIRTIKVSILFS
jgi:hypothetical protein